MFCCFGSCSRRPDFQKSISLRLALPNHFHAGSLIKFPFSCQCGEAIISLVIWYQRQFLHVLKSVTYHIFRSENFQQNLNCRYRVILPFSVISYLPSVCNTSCFLFCCYLSPTFLSGAHLVLRL